MNVLNEQQAKALKAMITKPDPNVFELCREGLHKHCRGIAYPYGESTRKCGCGCHKK